MTTLTEFLLARIAEVEAKAREPWLTIISDVQTWWDSNEDEAGFFADDQPDDVKGLAKTLLQIETARGTYDRVLAECDAKRQIVELLTDAQQTKRDAATEGHVWAGDQYIHALALVVERMAEVYADHPDRAQVTSL